MVKDVTSKQIKINNLIDDYGRQNINVIPMVEPPTYDPDNGWTQTTGTPFTMNAVVYDYVSANQDFREMGNLNEGDLRLITKGNVSIKEKDTFSYNSKTYLVSRVNPLPLANKQEGDSLAIVIDAVEEID